ncbi:MAG: hypothetical protein ACFE0P_07145 [Oceanicaulis sp.]
MSTVDLYYICQMVDGVTRQPGAYLRNIEDIFGDMPSATLVQNYPKWTCFHDFVEALISSVVYEDANTSAHGPAKLWIDHLLESNGIGRAAVNPSEFGEVDGYEYLDALAQEDLIAQLTDTVAKQVFHVFELLPDRWTVSGGF